MGLFYHFSQQILSSFEYIKLPSFVLNLQFFLIPVAFLFCYFFLSSFLRPFNRTSQMKLKILRDLLEIKYPLEKFIFCIHYLSSLEYSLTLPIAAINNANVRESSKYSENHGAQRRARFRANIVKQNMPYDFAYISERNGERENSVINFCL